MAIDTVASSGRGDVILVSVQDDRLAPHYAEDEGGISGDMDGPIFLAIGRNVDCAKLRKCAAREGIDASVLIRFRNNLKRRKLKSTDQGDINKARDYKTVVMRVVGLSEDLKIKYVVAEGKTEAAVQAEKAAHEAIGFSVVVWTASAQALTNWRNDCEKRKQNQGLPDEALEMLRKRFAVNC